MDFVTIVKAIILGLVEGLTEFAPISSTGHMIIVDDMWLKSEQFLTKYVANTFKVVIQLGSILAVIVVFKDRFLSLLSLGREKKRSRGSSSTFTFMHVIIGLIPAAILGVLFEDYIDEYLFSLTTVLVGLTVGAFFMIIADLYGPKNPESLTIDQMTYKQALVVGLFQCFSLWPGFSRSGSTISAGVLLGMSHRAAADFTFIMAVPIMLGASILSLTKNWQYFTFEAMPFFIAGFVSAFIFAFLSIRFFLKLINHIKLIPFAIYRLVLVLVIYIVYF